MNLLINKDVMEIEIIDFLLYGFGALLSYILYRVTNRIDQLESDHKKVVRDLNDVRVELPSKYITKAEHSRMMDAFFAKMDSVEAKMESRFETLFDHLKSKEDKK